MIITITSGSHWRNVGLNVAHDFVEDQFAHVYDPDDPEDFYRQAQNFITYSNALGKSLAPHVLLRPEYEDTDTNEEAHIEVELADWAAVVSTATGTRVVIE